MAQKVTSTDIKLALKEFHNGKPSYFITECKTCSTYFPDPQGLLKFDGLAIRNVLHMSQLKAFEEFLESKGYLIIPTVGAYEVLRAQKTKKDRKPKESPVIVYRKGGAKEHLSIMDKDFYLVNEFLRTKEVVSK